MRLQNKKPLATLSMTAKSTSHSTDTKLCVEFFCSLLSSIFSINSGGRDEIVLVLSLTYFQSVSSPTMHVIKSDCFYPTPLFSISLLVTLLDGGLLLRES